MEISKNWKIKEMKKKAAIFTLLSLVMVSVLIIAATSYNNQRAREESFVMETKIKAIDYFIDDLERDIKRGMYIATYRALVGMQQYISNEGTFVNDTDTTFSELIINGSINGTYVSVMNDTELNIWFDKIRVEAEKVSIDVDYEIGDVSVYHVNPWTLEIKLNVFLNISDNQNNVFWIRDRPLNTTLSIINFEDPLYSVGTYGRVIRVVVPTNVSDFVDGDDPSGLLQHIDGAYYLENNNSPSYLMRLRGDLNHSEYGIESIVDLRELEAFGLTVEEKSCIDYIYFSEDNPQNWVINNTYGWFRLDDDDNRLGLYESSSLIIT